jgi:hypothetical protein
MNMPHRFLKVHGSYLFRVSRQNFTLLQVVHYPEKENNCKKHLQNFLYNKIKNISIFSEISHLNGLTNKPQMPALLIKETRALLPPKT